MNKKKDLERYRKCWKEADTPGQTRSVAIEVLNYFKPWMYSATALISASE